MKKTSRRGFLGSSVGLSLGLGLALKTALESAPRFFHRRLLARECDG